MSITRFNKVAGELIHKGAVTTIDTAGDVTYTVAQLIGGMILRDPAGSNRNDVSPTAALIAKDMKLGKSGDSFDFIIRNTADAAETITLTGGTGVTISGTATIAQNYSRLFRCVLTTDASAATPTCTIYSIGTFIH